MSHFTHDERAVFIKKERRLRDKIMEPTNKAGEYARSGEANANFYRIANYLGITPEEVATIYALKHLDSILHAARTGKTFTEPLQGRYHDLANYVEIMHSISEERGLCEKKTQTEKP